MAIDWNAPRGTLAGAHVAGRRVWADAVFMKYDVLSAVTSVLGLVLVTSPSARWTVALIMGPATVLWLLGMGPLKGLPLKPSSTGRSMVRP